MAQSDDDFVDGGRGGELSQRVDENGHASQFLELFGGRFFFGFRRSEGGAMRVPSPAAGTMTNTFIGAISIVQRFGVGVR